MDSRCLEPPELAFRPGAQQRQPASPRASSEEKETMTPRPAGPAYFMRSHCQAVLLSTQASDLPAGLHSPCAGARLIPRIPVGARSLSRQDWGKPRVLLRLVGGPVNLG